MDFAANPSQPTSECGFRRLNNFVCCVIIRGTTFFVAPGARLASTFIKRVRSRLKAWMRVCAPNVLHAARPDSCRHAAK